MVEKQNGRKTKGIVLLDLYGPDSGDLDPFEIEQRKNTRSFINKMKKFDYKQFQENVSSFPLSSSPPVTNNLYSLVSSMPRRERNQTIWGMVWMRTEPWSFMIANPMMMEI